MQAISVLPKSPTNIWINLTGFGGAVVAIAIIKLYLTNISDVLSGFLILALFTIPIIILEALVLKSHLRLSTGLDFSKVSDVNVKRVFTKLLGFICSIGFLALIYWLFSEYRTDFYGNFYQAMQFLLPITVIVSGPYFFIIDRYMINPEDEYWHMGMFVLGRWCKVDRTILGQHIRGWLIRGFYLPLMLVYFFSVIHYIRIVNYSSIFNDFITLYEFLYSMIFAIDLLYVVAGYIFTVRLFDSHIRSAEPTMLGWIVTLECYQPFWNFSSSHYLSYATNTSWLDWFKPGEPIYFMWGAAILLLMGIYMSATIPFGLRFSNLTNRGIITNGPYKFSKHPAYIGKNLGWWLISVPFLSTAGTPAAIRHSILLLLVNLVYFMRARTEERHLSSDPAYVAYAEAMEERGIFSFLGKIIPALKFSKGKLFNLDR